MLTAVYLRRFSDHVTNQLIRRFQIAGRMKDSNTSQTRQAHQLAMESMMRDQGFVPVLDIDPVFTWEWKGDDQYDFDYTWQAVYVGEDKAWQITGVSGGKMIPSTPKTK